MDLESRGTPAGFVASSEFVEAAEAQSRSLGIRPAAAFVPHPIQDRSDAEMTRLARDAIEDLIALVARRRRGAAEPAEEVPPA